MSSNRNRPRPGLERLEGRLPLSGPGTLAQPIAGAVDATGGVTPVQVEIAPGNLSPGRAGTTFRILVQPAAGSGLVPEVVGAFGPDGRALAIRRGADLVLGPNSRALDFVRDGLPGPITVDVAGRSGTSGGFVARVDLNGDLLGTGRVGLDDLTAFAPSYLARVGGPSYSPAADANLNGQIGQGDARAIEANITPTTPSQARLVVELTLAPQNLIHGHTGWHNSGGITHDASVTILGHTTPGSLVFSDSGLGDYTFTGPFLHADAAGNFSINQKLGTSPGLTNTEFLVDDPYGHHIIRAFPILRIPT